METKKGNNIAVCIICGILTVIGMVLSIFSMIPLVCGNNIGFLVSDIADILVCAMIGYYALFGYQKPHGNLLKYIILINTTTHFAAIYWLVQLSFPWQAVIAAVIIGLCCYIAGRLHKVKQNVILMILVAILICINIVAGCVTAVATIGIVSPLIIWFDICFAYFLRYREHKEAGLLDAPKE